MVRYDNFIIQAFKYFFTRSLFGKPVKLYVNKKKILSVQGRNVGFENSVLN